MTAHRRPLFVVAAAALLFPACISIQADPTPILPAEDSQATAPRKTGFAEWPSRPGVVVQLNPDAKETKDTTAQRIATDQKPPDPNVKTAGDPPGQFPVGPVKPTPLAESPLLAAVRCHLEGHPEKAIELLKGLDKPNQELVLALLPILTRGATADLLGDSATLAALVEQLQDAAGQIEPRAALRLENVRFCRHVDGFGRYDPWPQGQPYRPHDRAQLYLEVRNLTSQPTPGPRGETHLTYAVARVEIRDSHGKRVPQRDREDGRRWVEVVQYEAGRASRGPLHDFHMLYPFMVPTTPGVYEITLELHDPVSRRTAKTAPVRFDVAGP